MIAIIRPTSADHLLLIANRRHQPLVSLVPADPVIFNQNHPGEDLDLIHHICLITAG